MAMLVMVSFEDDEAALSFVENVQDNSLLQGAEVKALYRMPTMFHEPFETHSGGRVQGNSFTKGQKYGWWVCSVCKKPSRLYWDSIFGESSFGKNLLSSFFTQENSI